VDVIGAPVGVSVVMPGRIKTGMNPVGAVEPAVVADVPERRRELQLRVRVRTVTG
jgi:hypothetical protein